MNFTLEDWYEVVEECLPAHVDADMAELDLPTFQKWIFSQLKAYLLRMTNKALVGGEQCGRPVTPDPEHSSLLIPTHPCSSVRILADPCPLLLITTHP